MMTDYIQILEDKKKNYAGTVEERKAFDLAICALKGFPIEKAKALIKSGKCKPLSDYERGRNYGLFMAEEILDAMIDGQNYWIPFDDDHKPEIGKEVIYSLKALPEMNIPNRIGIDCYFPNDHEWWKENVRGWIPAPKTYDPNAEEKKTTGHVAVSGKPLYLKTWTHKVVEMMEQEREKGSESMKDSV